MKLTGIILIFFCVNVNAQYNLSGTVKDSVSTLIIGASITLHPKNSNIILAYAITNNKGFYNITFNSLLPPDSFYIKANALGFAPQTKNISSFTNTINFSLQKATFSLPNISVQNTKPALRYKSDTLYYAVDSFKNKQDRTIGDVLKRLPGIEVDANGKISYQGKSISNFYIDGDNLLDDKYNLATTSIDADMVKDVQVLENHQPIKMLRNKTFSDKVAINLNLKDKARLKLMGRANMGTGYANEMVYDAAINLMAFKAQYKAINSFKANNTGKNITTDIISHNIGDFLKAIDNHFPQSMLNVNENGNPPIGQDRYLFNKTLLANFNNLFTLKKELQVKANIYLLSDNRSKDYYSNTYFFLPTDTIAYLQNQFVQATNKTLNIKLNLNSNATNHYINNTLATELNTNNTAAGTVLNKQNSTQHLQQNFRQLSNDFSFMKFTTSKATLQLNSYIGYLLQPESLQITPGVNANIFNNNINYQQLQQQNNIPGFYTNHAASIGFNKNKIRQSYTIGFTSQNQQLQSQLNVLQNNNQWQNLKDSFSNNLQLNRYTIKSNAAIEYLGERLKLNIALPINYTFINFNNSNNIFPAANNFKGFLINPNIMARYAVGLENFIQSTISYSNNMAGIENMYGGFILKNFQQVQSNQFVFNQFNIFSVRCNFNYRKTIKILFANAGASFSKNNSNGISNNIFQNQLQQLLNIPFNNTSNTINAFGGISKYVFKWHTTISFKGNVSFSNGFGMQNNRLIQFKNNSYTAVVNISPKINNAINLAFNNTVLLNQSANSLQPGVTQKILQVNSSVECNYTPTNNLFFTLRTDNFYIHKPTNNNTLNYFFADALCTYKLPKKKIDIQLQIQNIANVKEYKNFTINGNTLAETSNIIRPTTLLLKMFFNF